MLHLKNNIAMKQIVIAIALIVASSAVIPVFGQATAKEAEKDLNKKTMKIARKDAKRNKKDGFYVAPGALPMEKQLEKAYIKQNMEDEMGYPQYIVSSGNAVAETQTAARLQAVETAKLNLAGTISSNIVGLISISLGNEQLTREEAESLTNAVAASKNIISQELGRVIQLSEMYKDIGRDNIQCDVQIAYDSKTAMDVTKKAIHKKLEGQAEDLHKKLDELMDL